jgi:hypothetical protein
MLPFTHAEFLDVFARYNLAVWPAQLAAYALAAAMLAMVALRRSAMTGRLVAAGLAVMWAWTGIAYHWTYFSAINDAAWVFGALFVLQSLLFAHAAATRRLDFQGQAPAASRRLGWFLVAYATFLYPLVGIAAGPGYPALPMFGITPCPVTIYTFGLLLLNAAALSRWLLVIPVLWSLIGGSAATLLQVPQDWLLLLSAGSVFFVSKKTRLSVRSTAEIA